MIGNGWEEDDWSEEGRDEDEMRGRGERKEERKRRIDWEGKERGGEDRLGRKE